MGMADGVLALGECKVGREREAGKRWNVSGGRCAFGFEPMLTNLLRSRVPYTNLAYRVTTPVPVKQHIHVALCCVVGVVGRFSMR